MIEPEAYMRVFQEYKEGQQVLEDLEARFRAPMSYVKGGHDAERETCFREGHRFVIEFILLTIANRKFPSVR